MPTGIYKRTKPSWNKGLSKKADKRVKNHSLAMKEKRVSPKTEFKKGNHPKTEWKKGKEAPNWQGGLTGLQKQEIKAGRKRPDKCELCGRASKLVFDHNHKTGEFRGWICQKCNVALGLADDNIETLLLMIEYIKKHNGSKN